MTVKARKLATLFLTTLLLSIFLTSSSNAQVPIYAEPSGQFGDFVIKQFSGFLGTTFGSDLKTNAFIECPREKGKFQELDHRILKGLEDLLGEKVRIFDINSSNKDWRKKGRKFQKSLNNRGYPTSYLVLSSPEGKMTGILLLTTSRTSFEKPIQTLFGKDSVNSSRFWLERKTSVTGLHCNPIALWNKKYSYAFIIMNRGSGEKLIDPSFADLSEKDSLDSLLKQVNLAEGAAIAGNTYLDADESNLPSLYESMKNGYLACKNLKGQTLNSSTILEDHKDLKTFINTLNLISYATYLQEKMENTVKQRLKADTAIYFDKVVTEENIISNVRKLKLKGNTYEDNSPLIGETYNEKKFMGKGKFKKAKWSSSIPDKNHNLSLLYLDGLDTVENPHPPLTLVVTWPEFEGNISVDGAKCRAGIVFRAMLPLRWGREVTEPDHHRVMGMAGIADVYRNGKLQRGDAFFDSLMFSIYDR